jgi:glycosyltransferase involved in cell wall biosynthesis
MQRTGFHTLADVAKTILPTSPLVRHAAINHADARQLRRHLGDRSGWVPNLVTPAAPPSPAKVRQARRWLRDELGDDGPVWLVPCRLLRRKNLAEALLLTRWLRPEGWLVTTGGVSSTDEREYAGILEKAARLHGWRLRLSVLAEGESSKPSVPELLAASETILLTSLQEGFGLPILEAAAAHRPLIARTLPTIAPDLARFGFRFPQSYDDVQVDARLFDLSAERQRQKQRWRDWRGHLPRVCRPLAGQPDLIASDAAPRAVPFSRLTFAAQLEVLAYPPKHSWQLCAPLNPFLARWRRQAAAGALRASPWPRGAAKWLGGPAYGQHIAKLLRARPRLPLEADAGVHAAGDFIRVKLAGANQYPLLWTTRA